jgi:hypothetical protein
VDEVTDPDSGAIVGYSYPDVQNLAYSQNYDDGSVWEVWFMYSDVPGFQPKAGDEFLGGWERENDNQELIPPSPDLFEYVRPIGNELDAVTNTFDGTPDFPIYFNGLGAPNRFWGSVNHAPDDNQDRHVDCYRYETDWAGQLYQRVRFVLKPPFDKDNAPNALAILIYTDPERQSYFYTPGAFIWEPDEEYWYADTTIGQSPTGTPEPVYYCVALGSAPLNGGGTVPPFYNEPRTDADPVSGEPEHVSHNWDENLHGPGRMTVNPMRTRLGWRGKTSFEVGQNLAINNVGWQHPIIFPTHALIKGNYTFIPPGWMTQQQKDDARDSIEKASGRRNINAGPQ